MHPEIRNNINIDIQENYGFNSNSECKHSGVSSTEEQNYLCVFSGAFINLLIIGLYPRLFYLGDTSCRFVPGIDFALSSGQAHPKFNKKVSKYLLQYSVVGLGFGMNLQASLASGKEGMEFTVISVVGTMLIGWFIGRKFLKVDRDTSYLISSGTAICGGSAIAAVGPVLRAKDTEMSVALGTIFILNAIALFIFPVIGHALDMSQQEFGTWAQLLYTIPVR